MSDKHGHLGRCKHITFTTVRICHHVTSNVLVGQENQKDVGGRGEQIHARTETALCVDNTRAPLQESLLLLLLLRATRQGLGSNVRTVLEQLG